MIQIILLSQLKTKTLNLNLNKSIKKLLNTIFKPCVLKFMLNFADFSFFIYEK